MNKLTLRAGTRADSQVGKRARRWAVPLLAAGLVASLAGGPSVAQQIPDVPTLGLTISPSSGVVGSTVEGTVDAADVAEHCITTPEDFVAQLTGPLETAIRTYMSDMSEEWGGVLPPPGTSAFATMSVLSLVPGALAQDLELADEAMGATFVFAFADLATTSPIDPLGSFDRSTGEGSVVVPDLEPGTHPVIATCVGLASELTSEDIDRAVKVGQAYLEANYDPPFVFDVAGLTELGTAMFPIMLREMVEPKALGVAFYCVDDGEGSCDETSSTTEPPTSVDSTPGTSTPGTSGTGGGVGGATGAQPVRARPSYTG